jgi:hypothetical protein
LTLPEECTGSNSTITAVASLLELNRRIFRIRLSRYLSLGGNGGRDARDPENIFRRMWGELLLKFMAAPSQTLTSSFKPVNGYKKSDIHFFGQANYISAGWAVFFELFTG